MSFEIDEWDEAFLGEAINEVDRVVAEKASSSKNPISEPPPEVGQFNPSSYRPQQEEPFPSRNPSPIQRGDEEIPPFGFNGGGQIGDISFSPPRELSQRFPENPKSSSMMADCEIIGPFVSKKGGQGRRAGWSKKDKEVEKLKGELGLASKNLKDMEHKYLKLQRDRDWKDEQLKCAFSQIQAKDAVIDSLKRANLEAFKQDHLRFSLQHHDKEVSPDRCPISEDKFSSVQKALERTTKGSTGLSKRATESIGGLPFDSQMVEAYCPKRKGVLSDGQSAVSELKRRVMIDDGLTTSSGIAVQEGSIPEKTVHIKSSKTVGVQTDVQDCCHTGLKNISVEHDILSKLHPIWGSPSDKMSGRYLISKLLVTCSTDFYVLFRGMNMPSKINLDQRANQSFHDMALQNGMQYLQLNDAAKLSRLYGILMKIRNEMASWQILLEALLDLCALSNAVVVHRSLRILYAFLQHLSCGSRSGRSVLCSGTISWSVYLKATA